MIDKSIGIGFSLASGVVVEDSKWIWLEQQTIPETTTKKELADMLDDLFESSPCEESDKEEFEIPPEEEFEAAVKKHFDLDLCDQSGWGDYRVLLRVYRSHSNLAYTLRLTNGQVNSTKIAREVVEGSIIVKDVYGVVLDYPIYGDDAEFEWNTTPIDKLGNRSKLPITVTGNALNWGKSITGSIHYKYTTQYDLVSLTVNGTSEGEFGDCLVIAFYQGLYQQISTQHPTDAESATLMELKDKYCKDGDVVVLIDPNPDDVTCYVEVTSEYFCNCDDYKVNEIITEREVQCPEGMKCQAPGVHECRVEMGKETVIGGYVDCNVLLIDPQGNAQATWPYTEIVSDPTFYEEKCCEPPSDEITLPRCYKVKSLTSPKAGRLSKTVMDKYISQTNGRVRFEPAWPKNGNCGTKTITQNVFANQCCDKVTPLILDDDFSVDVMADNSSGFIRVYGGKLPLTITISGNGFYLNSSHSIKSGVTSSGTFIVYTGSACGIASITISDGCSEVKTSVMSVNGKWSVVYYAPGGINGMQDLEAYPDSFGYSGGCPFTAPAYGEYYPGAVNLQAVRGGERITQTFGNYACYGAGYLARSTWEGLTQVCGGYDCIAVPGYKTGSCFIDEGVGTKCMDVIVSNSAAEYNKWLDFEVGQHSCYTPPAAGETWYLGYQTWVFISYTKVEKWTC